MLALANGAWAASFTVNDIRINGAQRVDPATIMASIPVRVGGVYEDHMARSIVTSLFKTGLFEDVKVQPQGQVLVVNVRERMAIGQINFNGNNRLSDEQLEAVVRRIGLRPGMTLNRSALARVKNEVRRQYQAAGVQAVDVSTRVKSLGDNRVAIDINVKENHASQVSQVKIRGNRVFSDAELLKLFDTGKKGVLFWAKKEPYTRQKLVGDLEKLKAYYRDRGYIDFQIISPKVSLSPDKKNIAVDIEIKEGDQYRVGNVVARGTGLSQQQVQSSMKLRQGSVFSQRELEETRKSLGKLMGKGGYASPKFRTQPNIDRARKVVDLIINVDRGPRIYVRRIEFRGNFRTKDEVFRRELRQFESAWLSRDKIEQSRRKVQRLPYVESVNIRPVPVAGAPDQVDLEVTVKERLSNQFTAGLGYSQSQGVLFNVGLKQQNFMGSGKELGVDVNRSGTVNSYSLNYNDPYHTVDGIGRGFNLHYKKVDYDDDDLTSSYASNKFGGDVHYTFPMTEDDSLRFSLGAERTEIITHADSPQYIRDFVTEHGDTYTELLGKLSYVHDTRDRSIFPTEGNRQRVSFEVGLPGSDLSYYKIRYRGAQYWSLSDSMTLAIKSNVSYGEGFDDLDELPFFERFYAGGIGSVRGYEKSSLGARDENNDAVGGDFAVAGTAEVSFPAPFAKDMKNLRLSAFIDAGNVYEDLDAFEAGDIRYSVGIGATWLSPIGALTLSYAKPLNAEDGDDEQNLQFAIGATF